MAPLPGRETDLFIFLHKPAAIRFHGEDQNSRPVISATSKQWCFLQKLPLLAALYILTLPTELEKEVKKARSATITHDICSSIFLPPFELAQRRHRDDTTQNRKESVT